VNVQLWNNLGGGGTVLQTATVTVNAAGIYLFSWTSGGTQSLNPYDLYGITMYSTNGVTAVGASGYTISNSITNGVLTSGAPPFTGTVMMGPNCNWYTAGLQYAGTGVPFSHGYGSYTTYSPIEVTITP